MKNVLTQYMSVIWYVNIRIREKEFKTNANTNTKISVPNAIMSIYTEYTDQHKWAHTKQEGAQGNMLQCSVLYYEAVIKGK